MIKQIVFLFLVCIYLQSFLNAQMVFLEPPDNFKPKLSVAACYLMLNEKVLFLKRCSTTTWNDTWGVPGGKIEKNQSPFDAMVREVFEETRIDLSDEEISFKGKVYVRDPQKDFIFYMFQCHLKNTPKEIILAEDEHTEFRWLEPFKAIKKLSLIPGEDECIHLIYANENS